MQELTRKRSFAIGLRSRVPLLTRIAALVLLASGLAFVSISYYKLRNNKPFRLRSENPELSKEVTGIVNGYEQQITKNDRLYLLVRATRDITFSDNHHELENVSLSIYPPVGEKPDQITGTKGVYNPTTSIISFSGNVKIETKDALKVNTEALTFDQNKEVAETDSAVSFEHENISGKSTGAIVYQKMKRFELKRDVEVVVAPRATTGSSQQPSLRSRPVTIKSAHGVFEQDSLKLTLTGGVTAEQERDVMSGDAFYATLNNQKQLEKLEVRGNSYLRAMDEGRAAEAHSIDMDFFFDKDQRLERAVAMKDTVARSLDADSEMQLSGANVLDVKFQAQDQRSLLNEMVADGRSVVTLSAPKSKANDPRAANKRLTADKVKLSWHSSGRDLEKAEALGNAELYVEPLVKNAKAERKTITAPQFDCDFFETGNLARTFTATGGAKAVLEPLQPTPNSGTRTLTSQKMAAVFVKETQDVERLEAQGDGKFNENDRNGVADSISYVAAEEMVYLRGGEPTVWDSRGRTKGLEIDSDLRNDVSYSRGKTATTYYSQEQTNGATPFSKVKSPVYVVSDRAEFHHENGLATYTGNARAWQDDNFVRGDKLNIYMNEQKMDAIGHVQSGLYNSKRRIDNKVTVVPVFGSSDSMYYSDTNRVIHYEGNVDIRQAPDRITGGVADVYLSKETNEMEKTIAQRNVVLTQPTRKGTGEWVQYTADDEVAILKGNPARIDDSEKGNTEGGRLTLYVRDNRVIADDTRGPLSPGRVRSTHKIRKP